MAKMRLQSTLQLQSTQEPQARRPIVLHQATMAAPHSIALDGFIRMHTWSTAANLSGRVRQQISRTVVISATGMGYVGSETTNVREAFVGCLI